jgi:hypothetical protein
MNQERHFHTESERRQLSGLITDSSINGWTISKRNRITSRSNNLPDNSLIEYHNYHDIE